MITVIDYGVGNLGSIRNMFSRAGIACSVSGNPDAIASASRLVLPGVGHFKFAMEKLRQSGLIPLLKQRVQDEAVPLLGICLGAQMLGRRSEEGGVEGLGLVPMDVVSFDRSRLARGEKVPHMGWAATQHAPHPLFESMEEPPRFYYVHSFHFRCDDPGTEMCWAEHGYRFASGVRHANIMGVQFHPEKSHAFGQRLLRNFAAMDAAA